MSIENIIDNQYCKTDFPSENFRVFFFLIPGWFLLRENSWKLCKIIMKKIYQILPAFFVDLLKEFREFSRMNFFHIWIFFNIFEQRKNMELQWKFIDKVFCLFSIKIFEKFQDISWNFFIQNFKFYKIPN